MVNGIRFVMLGGFLGAGKTTAIVRLAQMHARRGRKVAIVTNDQSTDLVDTRQLSARGYPVAEVDGACFCCNFDVLTERIEALAASERPDVVLAEPVGSCADLVATVVQPMLRLYGGRIEVAPFAVLLKPVQGRDVLLGRCGLDGQLPAEAAYIVRKQLEEADVIVVNRVDQLARTELEEILALLRKRFPDSPILCASALTGRGFDELFAFIEQRGSFGRRILDIDYDTYAEGEARLGWLNALVRISAATSLDLDQLLLDVIGGVRDALAAQGAEAAHVKALGTAQGSWGVANLIGGSLPPELSRRSGASAQEVDLIVNARVVAQPALLSAAVRRAIDAAAGARAARVEHLRESSFKPARPQPRHRFNSAL